MIACLPMYYREELADAHQQYWATILDELQSRGLTGPDKLSTVNDMMAMWLDPALVLGQTCGMPYRLHLHGKVTLIGTPDFAVEDCPPGYYRSAVVVRADDKRSKLTDFRNSSLAYNQKESQSGYAAAFSHCKAADFWFESECATGAHMASARAVIEQSADIAFIDAVTWKLLTRYEPELEALRVLEWTSPTPGLPYIAASTADHGSTFDAIDAAITRLSVEVKSALQLRGIVNIASADYLAVPNPDI